MDTNIKIDLYADWVRAIKSELSSYGYNVESYTDDETAHTYLNLLKRLVTPTPRTIYKSEEFNCPDELSEGLIAVERKITNGDDLSPYLSRLLRKPDFNDPLLNHWGIHHIHLGGTIDSDGFIKRTGPVLFARFEGEKAYFINVLPHGSWHLQSLVKTIHINWPSSIESFKLNGVISSAYTPSDDDVKTLRKKNVNTIVEIENNVVYSALGGGVSSSGISTDVVLHSMHLKRRLYDMQQTIIDNINTIRADAEQKGAVLPMDPEFKLELNNGVAYALEINCMLPVNLGVL